MMNLLAKKMKVYSIMGVVFFTSPTLALAQCPDPSQSIKNFIGYFTCLLGKAVPVVFILIFLFFMWGLVKYMANGNNAESRQQGSQFMLWAVVALFVASSVWGLAILVARSFGFYN